MNETLTMQIIVAVAQDIENLTQHTHEEIDEMRQQMKQQLKLERPHDQPTADR